MAKKIKRSGTGKPYVDPELEEVGEDRAFELDMDEEANEILFVYHYRRKWGDEFDADVEHGLNMEEVAQLIGALFCRMEILNKKAIGEEKSTPIPLEGNPLKDNPVI